VCVCVCVCEKRLEKRREKAPTKETNLNVWEDGGVTAKEVDFAHCGGCAEDAHCSDGDVVAAADGDRVQGLAVECNEVQAAVCEVVAVAKVDYAEARAQEADLLHTLVRELVLAATHVQLLQQRAALGNGRDHVARDARPPGAEGLEALAAARNGDERLLGEV
jgi:hypothetical protein